MLHDAGPAPLKTNARRDQRLDREFAAIADAKDAPGSMIRISRTNAFIRRGGLMPSSLECEAVGRNQRGVYGALRG
jgi:hypothetical protein